MLLKNRDESSAFEGVQIIEKLMTAIRKGIKSARDIVILGDVIDSGLRARWNIDSMERETRYQEDLEKYLAVARDFKLGALETEQPHPDTGDLSRLAREDPTAAVSCLKAVDVAALEVLQNATPDIEKLAGAIDRTLEKGNRVYLCGCGATGRLSLSIEFFCREGLLPADEADRIVAFMAGGDTALIRSIEKFEDHPEYGARQLDELGFAEGDLLIASTEGGETPFVIGATERASGVSSNQPFFLYCNPDETLCKLVERSRRVIEHPGIHKINLTTGPMALSGSTRMQASTVLMAAIAWAMECRNTGKPPGDSIRLFREHVESLDFGFLTDYIVAESAAYSAGEFVLYDPDRFGITVLTDTTERAPTFSIEPFENADRPDEKWSRCYLHVPGKATAAEAWESLLSRPPRSLDWPEVSEVASKEVLLGFDISDGLLLRRQRQRPDIKYEVFRIGDHGDRMTFSFAGFESVIPLPPGPVFTHHLLLKLLLNIHSTIVMARLGRCEDNLMVYVSASNNKLIDRAIRYVQLLLERHHNTKTGYNEVARHLFKVRSTLEPDEPVVLKTVESCLAGGR